MRAQIMDGSLVAGSRLPPIDQLAVEFGVSRMTLRQALAILSEEGLIQSIQGRGTFIAAIGPQFGRVRLESSWKQLLGALEGNKPVTIEINEHVESLPKQPNDGISTGNYRFMRRVHDADGQVYCLIEIYLDRDVYEASPEIFDTQMVIPQLQRVPGIKLKQMRQTFQIGSANLEIAKALGIKLNSPTGIVRRIVKDDQNRILYLGSGHYRGDLVIFETTIDVVNPSNVAVRSE
jgi:GntR family transcriptional regulator